MHERWKPIAGYEGHYEVSDHGRVKSVARTYSGKVGPTQMPCIKPLRERILRPVLIKKIGYFTVVLCRDGITRRFYIHRLVASAFIPNPSGFPEVNHLDSCRTNCHWSNLEWTNRAGNLRHAGQRMSRPKLTEDQVRHIRAASAAGVSKETLAMRYGVHSTNIHAIVIRKSWKHVR